VKLIIQPDDGIAPLLVAIKRAKKSIDIVIFRFDRMELAKALAAAVGRGVVVRALVAHTNRGGEKRLRKLEMTFLEAGVTVCRTADDLTRHHGKMMIVDGELYVFGFNYTELDINRSRSFGIATKDPSLVKAASALFQADSTRQPYEATHDRLVISPETSRKLLSQFIKGAKKELLIYDEKVSDKAMVKLLRERVAAGVEVKVIGKVLPAVPGIATVKSSRLRLHVRAMVRDRKDVFVGSQSLRRPQIDGRREIGIISPHSKVASAIARVFDQDWNEALPKTQVQEKEKAAAEALEPALT
jgi:phosphatidylserine/phosphatidylglycerophosphate/cardiolipin synthase-like enzyme